MSKKIMKALICTFMLAICLCACSGEPNNPSPTKVEHITKELSDSLRIDADVIYPQQAKCSSYVLKPLQISEEKATQMFFPNDVSSVTVSYGDERKQYDEGHFVLTSENGGKFNNFAPVVSYRAADESKYFDIMESLCRYAEQHPDEAGKSIEFMRAEDAVKQGTELLENLGIPFTAKNEVCVGLDHDEICAWMQYQQRGYTVPERTSFIPELGEEDDAYYLRFSFEYNGIDIYKYNCIVTTIMGTQLPNNNMGADILITRKGVQMVDIYGAYSVEKIEHRGVPVSIEETIEDALKNLKESHDNVNGPTDMTISKIYLEYIPKKIRGKMVLTPYWCLEGTYKFAKADGHTYTSESELAERFNAFTGKNICYGG